MDKQTNKKFRIKKFSPAQILISDLNIKRWEKIVRARAHTRTQVILEEGEGMLTSL